MASHSADTREPDRHSLEAPTPRRPRGRPALRTRSEVLDEIRTLARRGDGLFRVHRSHPDLYARARRFFGAWAEAVKGAGIDYESVVRAARSRSREPLRKRREAPAGR